MSKGKTSHEMSGPQALKRAKSVLSSYDLNGDVERIFIEIEETYPDESRDTDSTEDPEDTEQAKSDNPQTGRVLRGIEKNTSHHRVLNAINELEDDENISSMAVNEVVETPYGTVTGALRELYDRRLVERERISEDGTSFHVYTLSSHGKAELDRLGEPT